MFRLVSIAPPEEERLLREIRDGDEDAFLRLVNAHQPVLAGLARSWVRDRAIADEVVQETWVVMLDRLHEFAGRSSLRTWLCGILVNVARARLRRESRTVPLSALAPAGDDGPAVDPARFLPTGHHWEGHWLAPPTPWPDTPEQRLLGDELRRVLQEAIERLPEAQREVLVLCDVQGFSGEEACEVLGLTSANQRVHLHRARSRLRGLLEAYCDGGGR